MMENYPRIAVKNVCVVDVCFRRSGRLYNEGKIVLDIDSYDFAGYLTNDVIIGLYKNGEYTIHYYYNVYKFDGELFAEDDSVAYQVEEYLIEMSKEFKRTTPDVDFVNNEIMFRNGLETFVLSFNMIVSEKEEIEKALNHNMDLLMPKN